MSRHGWLLSAVAAVALALGTGTAWWWLKPAAVTDEITTALFSQTFPTPEGKERALADYRGKLLIVNFWATWCAPCVEEMPDLQQVRDEFAGKGVEVLGIGIDNAKNIVEFRDRFAIRFPLFVAGSGGSELARALGNQAGALPFTVLVSRDGQVIQRKLGPIKPAELRLWVEAQTRVSVNRLEPLGDTRS